MNTIDHDVGGCRFSVVVDGHRAVLDYALTDDVMTIVHTGVPDAIAGRGVAASLMRAAVAAAHEAGWRIVPQCSYAATFLQRIRPS